MNKVLLCITGASGAIYGYRLLEVLSKEHRVDLVVSDSGRIVLREELDEDVSALAQMENVSVYENRDLTAPVASGSRLIEYRGVIVAPCSMSTLASVAKGINDNLIHRACEVALKEKVPLVLLVREMPYSKVHIRNMLEAQEAGAVIMPASPGFYHRPSTLQELVDFVVGKVLDALRIEHGLYRRWKA